MECGGKELANVGMLLKSAHFRHIHRDEKKDFNKIKIHDALNSLDEAISAISGWSWLMLSIATLFWVFRSIKVLSHAVQYWDVKKFYNTVLKIADVCKWLWLLLCEGFSNIFKSNDPFVRTNWTT